MNREGVDAFDIDNDCNVRIRRIFRGGDGFFYGIPRALSAAWKAFIHEKIRFVSPSLTDSDYTLSIDRLLCTDVVCEMS
jgi:hypothetical protein